VTATATLHIVFHLSAALGLRKALAEVGREETVISFPDDLAYGPIDPPDPELRNAWVEEQLEYEATQELAAETQAFWTAALGPPRSTRRVAWVSRRVASEYAGFLEVLWRLEEALLPCDLVDLTDFRIPAGKAGVDQDGRALSPPMRLAMSLPLLPAFRILEARLFDRAEPLSPDRLDGYREMWRRLRAENAPLRIVEGDELVSAPITAFDSLLLSFATQEWQPIARVARQALAAFDDASLHQSGDLVVLARIRALAATGRLESRGDLSGIRATVRLPSRGKGPVGIQ
jgi:hypothetical protein